MPKNAEKYRYSAFFDFANEEQNVQKGAGGGKNVQKGAFLRHVFGDILALVWPIEASRTAKFA